MTRYAYGTTLADSGVARSDLLRAEIYPDSDDVASPLGNGPDGVYDRFEMRYNRQGEVIERKDPASTIHALDYDKLGRQTHDRVTALGPQVNGAVRRISRAYEVRGMLLEVTSWDNAAVGSGAIVNQVRLAYNTFAQPVIEYQEHGGAVNTSTSPKVQYGTANGAANTIRPISVTYPNGRVVVWDYSTTGSTPDALSRIARIFVDNVQVASYVYLGLGRIVQVDHPQPFIRYDLVTGSGSDLYAGLDRFGRVIDSRWRDYGSGKPIDAERIQYGYDRASNRKYRENTVDTSTSKAELYGYDGMYRLKTFERGTLNAAKTALTTKTFAQQWNLDATGNWSGFNEDTNGDGTWELGQTRASNKVNEIQSFTNSPGPTWFSPTYDAAGNMTIAPVPSLPGPLNFRSQEFDAWNRLTKAVTATAVLGEFAYDGLNRRITKKTFSGGTPLNTRHFYHSQDWQVLEERIDSATVPQRQFVWGIRYIDDLLLRDRDTNADGTLDERLYGVQDDNWNLVALADTGGDIQERYRYDAYGLPTVLTTAFAARSASLFDWETLYASYCWDADTKMYQVRNRWLDSRVGAWISRDPLVRRTRRTILYEYVDGRPLMFVDAFGTLKGSAGVVGAIQFCVDLCTGHFRTTGWVWGGAGAYVGGFWWGFSAWAEGTIWEGDDPAFKILPCGECAKCCKPEEHWWGYGPAIFKEFGHGRKTRLGIGPLDCGVIFALNSTNACHGKIEGICLLNVLESGVLGPIGPILSRAAEYVGGSAKAGIVGSISLAVCKGINGGVVLETSEICLGGFIEIGWDLGGMGPGNHPEPTLGE